MKKTLLALTIFLLGLLLFTIDIRAQMQSTNYRITTNSVSGGAGLSARPAFPVGLKMRKLSLPPGLPIW